MIWLVWILSEINYYGEIQPKEIDSIIFAILYIFVYRFVKAKVAFREFQKLKYIQELDAEQEENTK